MLTLDVRERQVGLPYCNCTQSWPQPLWTEEPAGAVPKVTLALTVKEPEVPQARQAMS